MNRPPETPLPAHAHAELLQRLQALIAYVSRRRQVEGDLTQIAADTASMFGAEACSVMLFKDGGSELRLHLTARSRPLPKELRGQGLSEAVGEGLAGRVAASGRALLVADLATSEFAGISRHHTGSCICAPIPVAGRVRGVLNLSRPQPFTHDDLALACIAGLLLGLALELARIQDLLRSRFAHRAMAEELREHPEMDAGSLGADAGRMARVLGRTFFRELRSAGYGSDHILTAATEVIGELGRDIGNSRKAGTVADD